MTGADEPGGLDALFAGGAWETAIQAIEPLRAGGWSPGYEMRLTIPPVARGNTQTFVAAVNRDGVVAEANTRNNSVSTNRNVPPLAAKPPAQAPGEPIPPEQPSVPPVDEPGTPTPDSDIPEPPVIDGPPTLDPYGLRLFLIIAGAGLALAGIIAVSQRGYTPRPLHFEPVAHRGTQTVVPVGVETAATIRIQPHADGGIQLVEQLA